MHVGLLYSNVLGQIEKEKPLKQEGERRNYPLTDRLLLTSTLLTGFI